MASGLGLFSPSTFASWVGVLKDGGFDWPTIWAERARRAAWAERNSWGEGCMSKEV